MKVYELLIEDKHPKLTKAEMNNLPAPDAKNIKDRYKVESVAFDNVKGMGAVPYNQEVDYMGFAMELTPATFLKFAAYDDRSDDAARIVKQIQEGTSIGAPYLWLELNYKEYQQGKPLFATVEGHEGRARMTAIHDLVGDVKVPVHVFLRGGLRAHSLSEKFFSDLRDGGMVPENTNVQPIKAHIGRIFWMGKTL